MKMAIAFALTFAGSVALATGTATTTKTETKTATTKTAPADAAHADHATTTTAATTTTTGETMTVEGPIAKVVAAKKEIYVQGADAKHEFYFKPTTELTQNGQKVDFATLKEGTKVRVQYTKVGKRTEPTKVEILQ